MPEKINPQPEKAGKAENKKVGKLTPEEVKKEKEKIKEEVKRFKEEREGLLTQFSKVPGEGMEEQEEEYPEELLIAYRLKQYLKEKTIGDIYPELVADERFKNSTIEEEMRNERLWENEFKEVVNVIQNYKPENSKSAVKTFRWYYVLLKSLRFLPKNGKFRKNFEQIERMVKQGPLLVNIIRALMDYTYTASHSSDALNLYCQLQSSGLWSEIKKIKKLKDWCEIIENKIYRETFLQKELQRLISFINNGQKPGKFFIARVSFNNYTTLKSSKVWLEKKESKDFKEILKKIENEMKNENLWKNMLKDTINHIYQDQQSEENNLLDAWWALNCYSSLRLFISDLKKTAQEKMKQKELDQALHPKKDIPKRPEIRSF